MVSNPPPANEIDRIVARGKPTAVIRNPDMAKPIFSPARYPAIGGKIMLPAPRKKAKVINPRPSKSARVMVCFKINSNYTGLYLLTSRQRKNPPERFAFPWQRTDQMAKKGC